MWRGIDDLLKKLEVQYQDNCLDPALKPLREAKQANDARINASTSGATTLSLLISNRRLDKQIAELTFDKLDPKMYQVIGDLFNILDGDEDENDIEEAMFTEDEEEEEEMEGYEEDDDVSGIPADLNWLEKEDPNDETWAEETDEDAEMAASISSFSIVSTPEWMIVSCWIKEWFVHVFIGSSV